MDDLDMEIIQNNKGGVKLLFVRSYVLHSLKQAASRGFVPTL